MTSKAFELAQLGDAVTVDGSGNVGVGVSPVAGSKMTINDSAYGGLQFQSGGSDCGYIGVNANKLYVGAGSEVIFQTGHAQAVDGTARMRINSSGRVALTSDDDIFTIKSTATSGTKTLMLFHDGADTYCGQINMDTSANSVGYITASDYRLKENVTTISNGISRVKQLAPKRFNFIADANKTVDGFLAHEAQAVVPEAVAGTHNEVDSDNNPVYQGIDQAKLVPLLTAALQEAIAKIETLETENVAIKARLDALEAD